MTRKNKKMKNRVEKTNGPPPFLFLSTNEEKREKK